MTGRYRIAATGPFPRPEALVKATRDLDRGRIRPEEAEAAYAEAEREVARVETELGLDARTGGHLRWPDLFRPFTLGWTGVRAGPLTRFFETNTFYRQPILEAPPSGGRAGLAGWVPRGSRALAILPGPYTFAALADVRYRPTEPGGATVDVAAALAADLEGLGGERPERILFHEPMLVVDPPREAWPSVLEAYRRLAAACAGAASSVWTYFGDAGPLLEELASLPVGAVGFDLLYSDLRPGATVRGKAVGLGVLDPSTTIPEAPGELARLVRAAEAALRPTELWLGPNPPLDLLPFDAATAKLRTLPALREELGR